MKINGHEYSQEEIFEALRNKGYLLIPYLHEEKWDDFMGGYATETVETKCAVKGADLPSEKNLWTNIAIKEFEKEFVKPPLV